MFSALAFSDRFDALSFRGAHSLDPRDIGGRNAFAQTLLDFLHRVSVRDLSFRDVQLLKTFCSAVREDNSRQPGHFHAGDRSRFSDPET